jgi:hypothetical protein
MPPPKGHLPYNTNGEGGRPPKYSQEAIETFAEELKVWISNPTNYWLKDFCLEKMIDPTYMIDWARENDRFRQAYNLAKAYQESRMFRGGMTDKFNSGMTKFGLINNHGWADKTETKLSGDANNPLAFILDNVGGLTKDLVDDEIE